MKFRLFNSFKKRLLVLVDKDDDLAASLLVGAADDALETMFEQHLSRITAILLFPRHESLVERQSKRLFITIVSRIEVEIEDRILFPVGLETLDSETVE